MKKALTWLLVLVLMLSFAACGDTETATSDPAVSGAAEGDATAEGVEYKDTLVVGTYGDQDNLDPQVNVSNDKILRLMYDGLLTFNQDGEVEAALAETWEHSEDYLTWTFNLRQDVKFANGKDFTSADVVATFERLMNEDLRYSSKVDFLSGVTAIDDYTVEFTCEYPYAITEMVFASQYSFILDADYIAEFGADIGFDVSTVNGTGPYTITTWDPEEQMIFAANEHWWGGEVGTANIIYKVIPEAASRAMAIETAEVDILDRPSVDDFVRLSETEGLVTVSQLGYGLQGFQFNVSEDSMCADTLVRQAISHALDRETAVQALYGDIGEVPTTAPVTPLVEAYKDFGVVEYNVDLAKELLAEAGYADGFDLDLMTYAGYNKGVELAEIVKSQLAEVGINVTIETVDAATFNATLNGITPEEMKWDMFIMGYGGQLDADSCLRRVFMTSEDGLNTNNYGWYSNERVDELLVAAVSEMDEEARAEMYQEIMEIVYMEDPVAVYFNLRSSLYVMSDKVENFNINALQVVEFEDIKVQA